MLKFTHFRLPESKYYDDLKAKFLRKIPIEDQQTFQQELANAAQQPAVSLWPLIYVECLLQQAKTQNSSYDFLVEIMAHFFVIFEFKGDVMQADFEQNGINSVEKYNKLQEAFKVLLVNHHKSLGEEVVQDDIADKVEALYPQLAQTLLY